MATDVTGTLARLEAGQADLTSGQAKIAGAQETQNQLLRLIAERLGLLLEKLTPQIGEGPTMQELLAELVRRVGENEAFLRRIDRRTESIAMSLANDGPGSMRGASGANGDGSDGRGANGGAGA